jgi:hypothetical protein
VPHPNLQKLNYYLRGVYPKINWMNSQITRFEKTDKCLSGLSQDNDGATFSSSAAQRVCQWLVKNNYGLAMNM